MNKTRSFADTDTIDGRTRLSFYIGKGLRKIKFLSPLGIIIKKLREPFLPKCTEAETPQVTPVKLPYGTRKAPLSAASFPS